MCKNIANYCIGARNFEALESRVESFRELISPMPQQNAALRAIRRKKRRKRRKRRNHMKQVDSSSSDSDHSDSETDQDETKTIELSDTTTTRTISTKDGIRKIYVRYAYIPFISEICTSAQQFTLRIDYDLYWDTTEKEREQWRNLKENEKDEYKPCFKPQLVLQNCVDLELCEAQNSVEGTPWVIRTEGEDVKDKDLIFGRGKMMNFVRYEVRGTFQQKMNTIHYPFDCQILHVYMNIKYQTADKCLLVPCTKSDKIEQKEKPLKVFYLLQQYNATQEWDIVPKLCGGEVNGKDNWPWLVCKIVVHRRPWGFLWKYMSVLSFLTWCAVAAFSIEGRADLMGFLITLQLTIVALQYAVNSELPPCPLPSFADTTMIAGNVFTSALTIVSAFLPEDEDTEALQHGDMVIEISSVVLVIIHIALFSWAVWAFRNSDPHNDTKHFDEDVASVIKDNNPKPKKDLIKNVELVE